MLVAANVDILRELMASTPADLRGLRGRALLLVGIPRALRRSEPAGIALTDFERTDGGYDLTLKRREGFQTGAVLFPLLYGRTELYPVRALAFRLAAADIAGCPVFRRIRAAPEGAPDAPPLPAVGRRALDHATERLYRAGRRTPRAAEASGAA